MRAAKDVYGISDSTRQFKIGDANLSRVDTSTHRMVVRRNGKRVRDVGISAGKGGSWMFTTTNGVHAVMRKANPVVMTSSWMGVTDPADPRYYKLTVFDAVQISSSGEYVHSAPWSGVDAGQQQREPRLRQRLAGVRGVVLRHLAAR